MSIGRAGSAVVVFLAGAFAASPARAQTEACPKQSATGHIEVIGTVVGVNLGRHIIYSFSAIQNRSEEHTSELQSRLHLVCRLLLEKKKQRSRRAHGDVRTDR